MVGYDVADMPVAAVRAAAFLWNRAWEHLDEVAAQQSLELLAHPLRRYVSDVSKFRGGGAGTIR